MTTSEKVAYLKGLVEGQGIDTTTKEGKLLGVILEILEDLALDVQDLESDVAELNDGLDVVSDDLELVEDALYDFLDELDDLDDDEDDWDDDEDEDDDLVFYETECPGCGEIIALDEDMLDEASLDCPACGATLLLTGDDEEDGDEE